MSTFSEVSSAQFWTSIAPECSITADHIGSLHQAAYAAEEIEASQTTMQQAGFVHLQFGSGETTGDVQVKKARFSTPASAVPLNDLVKTLASAVQKLVQSQWHPIWVVVFDETWILAKRLERMVQDLLKRHDLHLNMDFFAWFLDPSKMQRGWGPHRDRETMPFDAHGLPEYVTVWVPLTEATLTNGCMYVVPAYFDPEYIQQATTTAAESTDFDIQSIQAVPASVGSCLLWSGRLLHFGGRASFRAAHPRISLSFALSHPSFEDPFVRLPEAQHRPWHVLPSLAERLRVIATQLWTYEAKEPLDERTRFILESIEEDALRHLEDADRPV
eukprot:GILK01007638.1.p1 GENE.GILK01007638.1~~GILK01007638.1.p1  ORF type:complete len:330 (+),score=30.33 GILK01007638.1:40-1029(+)